jgi:lysozyme
MKLRCLCLVLPALLVACAPAEGPLGATREALMVCAGPKTLKGIDISHYDGDIDWAKVAAAGNSFAFAKATEGTTFVDPMFSANWAAMKQSGVVRSAYHFFHANDDPIAQADFLLQTMGPLAPGDLPPTLDLEVSDGESAATITESAIAWLDHVAQATGKKPILYTSKRVVTEYLGNAMGLDQHAVLWDANWDVSCPDLPDTYATWTFWQNTDAGTVPGISGTNNVDLDVYNGDLADLQALGVQTSSGDGGGGASAGGTSNASSGAGGKNGGHATGAGGAGGGGSANAGGGSSSNDADSSAGCTFAGRGHGANGAVFGLMMLLALGVRRRQLRRA